MDIRQGLADSLFCLAAQAGLATPGLVALLETLSRATPASSTGSLDGVTAALLFAALAAMDVSAAGTEAGEHLPIVSARLTLMFTTG